MPIRRPDQQADAFHARQAGTLPDLLGIRVDAIDDGAVTLSLAVEPKHLAPNGYLHAGSVVTLADTACGYGCIVNLPEGATGFTTIELKSNFLGTAREGTLSASRDGAAPRPHDAGVGRGRHAPRDGRTIALFRCTQMILWPKP